MVLASIDKHIIVRIDLRQQIEIHVFGIFPAPVWIAVTHGRKIDARIEPIEFLLCRVNRGMNIAVTSSIVARVVATNFKATTYEREKKKSFPRVHRQFCPEIERRKALVVLLPAYFYIQSFIDKRQDEDALH